MMLILNAWAISALSMTIVWLIYMRIKNPGIVDVAWSLGIMLIGIYLAHPVTLLHKITLGLLIMWALRLSGYLMTTRILKGEKDKRYLSLQKKWKTVAINFFLNYQLQAVLQVLVGMGVYSIFLGYAPITWLSCIAIAVIITGIIGETVADYQLSQFKADHAGQKKVCNRGVWKQSRHPNYFFDWLVWLGFAILSIGSPYAAIAWISPITMYIIFNHITGPLTEKQSLASRGDLYLEYKQVTPMFFPKVIVTLTRKTLVFLIP